jgi:hypothetical protein
MSELSVSRAADTPDFERWPVQFSRRLLAWEEGDYLCLCLEAAVATTAEEDQAQPSVEAEGEARREAGTFLAPDWLP